MQARFGSTMPCCANQATASLQGNPDPVLYQVANGEFGTGGNAACNASLGNKVGVKCAFYDVTQGDMDVPCVPGSAYCYAPSGNNGVLSVSTSRYVEAYRAHSGWDSGTGLGSVNAANLVAAWPR